MNMNLNNDRLLKLQALKSREFNISDEDIISPEFIYHESLIESYYYNNNKKLASNLKFSVNFKILDYFFDPKNDFNLIRYRVADNQLQSIILSQYNHNNRENIVYYLHVDTFDDIDGFTLKIYGYNLDINNINNIISKFPLKIKENSSTFEIGMLKMTKFGLNIGWFDIQKPKIDIELNYGLDFFKNHYPKIVNKLENVNKGVIIFESCPGTGKSFLIKHLASIITNRKFIYLSDSIISKGLDNPDLIQLLTENKNCILIIEDAEKYIVSRDDDPNSFVSNLLNLTDGILSDLLGFSVILTHNMKMLVKLIKP